MTRSHEGNGIGDEIQLLAAHGFEGMAEAIEILLNEAMKLERQKVLQAAPCERTEQRAGYANGYKAKTVNSRQGQLNLRVPQTRDVEFYPSALERGERALKLTVAEMYVQGVSTRKVAAITEELEAWRSRALGRVPYVILDARY